MRIDQIVLPSAGTFSLNFPQDGVTTAANLRRAAATRGAQAQISTLSRPNGTNALGSVNQAELVIPKVVTDANGNVTYGSPSRVQITVRVGYDANTADLADLKSTLQELIMNPHFIKFLVESDRMI